MPLAGAHHPVQQQQRLGGVAAIDGVGEIPRRHSPGVAEERLDIDDLQRPRVAVRRHQRVEDALHPAGVLAEPRRQQRERLLVELQPGGDDLLLEPAATLAGTRRRRGVDDVAAGLLHRVGQRLRHPPTARDQHQLGAGQRIAEVGDQRRDIVGPEPADAASDDDPRSR